jgi:hypothetical protein
VNFHGGVDAGAGDFVHSRRWDCGYAGNRLQLFCISKDRVSLVIIGQNRGDEFLTTEDTEEHGETTRYVCTVPFAKKMSKILLRSIQFAVFSVLRTNFAEMPVESQ